MDPIRIYMPDGITETIRDKSPQTASYLLYYHYIFRTKWSKDSLSPEMADAFIDTLLEVCEERGYVLFGVAMMPDHVHLILSLKPTDSPYEPMQYIKGRISRELRMQFTELEGDSLWGDGYYVEAVGKKNIWQVLHYVSRQDEHHNDPA